MNNKTGHPNPVFVLANYFKKHKVTTEDIAGALSINANRATIRESITGHLAGFHDGKYFELSKDETFVNSMVENVIVKLYAKKQN